MSLFYTGGCPAPNELKQNPAYVTVMVHQQQQRNVKKMEPCPAYELTRPH